MSLRAVVIGLLIVVASGTTTFAQSDEPAEPPKLSIQPVDAEGTYFTLEMEPGQERELAVRLGNFGTEPAAAKTYAADVRTQINGGLDIAPGSDETGDVTGWLDYSAETFELEPGESRMKRFDVSVPEDAEPGEYLTSVVIETAEPVPAGEEPGAGGIGLNQTLRQAIAVFITLPGDAENAVEIGDAGYRSLPAGASVRVEVSNTGRLIIAPAVEVTIRDASGEEVTSSSIDMDSFYPDTSTLIEVGLLQPLEPGDYTVDLRIEEEELSVSEEGLSFTVEEPEVSGTPEPAGIATETVTISEIRSGDDALQAVEIVTTIENGGAAVSGARLTLTVERDGEIVEEYVLGSSLSFPAGSAEFRQRYIPLDGWEPGTYTFSVTLEGTDPNNDELVELSTAVSETTVTVE